MAKYINLNSATDEDIVAYLLDYWHIDSFKFEGDFNPSKSVESSVSGAFSNIQSATSKRPISFYPPMIKGLKMLSSLFLKICLLYKDIILLSVS